ncbi:hypothetical protein [Pontibacter pamirensis]|uniref:hypothetical protein n=1 Tax=Pontibacter pamirensis TaxID=2562824 RepID=UPI001389FCC5|nr:hypothetical protein [Pontibacter pamirensis]
MTPEELEERMADTERVLALHGKRLEKLEQQTISERDKPEQANIGQAEQAPNPCAQFEELKKILRRQDLSVQALQVHTLISSFRDTISKLPKVLPVRHHHHFEDNSRGFVTGGIILLLTTAVSVGLSFGLYRENSRLVESGVKLKMIRQVYPGAALWVDSTFARNPEEAINLVEKLVEESDTLPLQERKKNTSL